MKKKSFMKQIFTPLFFKVVISIGAFFVSLQSTKAQIINESFEESVWITNTNPTSNNTVVVTQTLTNSTLSYYTSGIIGTVVTNNGGFTTNTNNASNTGTWLYSNGISCTDSKLNKVHSVSHSWRLGSSTGYLITPTIAAGVSSITFWAALPNSPTSIVVGINTNATATAATYGVPVYSSTASAAPASYTYLTQTYGPGTILSGTASTANTMSSMTSFSFTVGGGSFSGPCRVGFFSATGNSVYIDDIVIVTACVNPSFSTQPSTSAQTVCQGGTTTDLTVAASPVISYQWYSNTTNSNSGGTSISGATAATYTPSNATAGALYYYCEAINGACITKSNVSGLVTINPTSVGGTVSSDAIVCSGTNSGTLTLSGKTGTVDKWQSSTVSDFSSGVTDIVNTTTSQTYTNLSANTYYRAVVSSGVCPAANSSGAAITMTTPPDVSNFSVSAAPGCQGSVSAITITSSSLASKTYTVTYDLTGTNTGSNITASVTMSGGTGSFNTAALANPGSTTITITSIAEGSCPSTVSVGGTAFTVAAFPTITLGTNPTVCYSASGQTANLSYSATTSSPTTYSISGWSGGSFSNVTNAALAAAPSNIAISVPAATAAGTYTATLTVMGTCISTNYSISVTVNQVTVTPTSQTVSFGATSMSLPVVVAGTPNEYTIDFTDVSFTDISYTTYSGSPITPIAIPAITTAGTYNANITVRNTTTGCVSPSAAFTVTYSSLATNSFRSKNSGVWGTAGNWESSSDLVNWYTSNIIPDYQSTGITVLSPHTITIAAGTTVNADSLKVKSGATLVLANTGTLTVNNDVGLTNDVEIEGIFENQTTANPDFTATGTMLIASGGTYKVNGYTANALMTLTNVTFAAGTTGGTLYVASGVPRLSGTYAGNVVWDSPSASSTFLNGNTTISGNFTIISTGVGGINNGSGGAGRLLTVSSNMFVQGGEYYIAGTSGNPIAATLTTTVTLDITISGGTVGIYGSTFGYTSGTISLTGRCLVSPRC